MKFGPDSDKKNAWRPDDTCDFCGGWRPSRFLEAIAQGCEVTPTDKSYKLYIDVPDPDAGKMRIYGSSNSVEKPSGEGWERWSNERALAEGGGWLEKDEEENWMLIGPTPAFKTMKVYTNHFSEAQAVAFVELCETGKTKFKFPGHLYRPLAFGEYKDAITRKLAEIKKAKFDAAKAAESTGQPPEGQTPPTE